MSDQTAKTALRHYVATLDMLRSDDVEDYQDPPEPIAAYPITRSATRRNQEALPQPVADPHPQEASERQLALPGQNMLDISRPAAMHEYRPCHIDTKDAITFASVRIKDFYDARHQPQFFKVDGSVDLRLQKGYQVPADKNRPTAGRFFENH